jgi:uncharacterized protein YndB with AHSA1/START domain
VEGCNGLTRTGRPWWGRFVELDPPHRLVIAYGWEDDLMGVPPESTTVEIELVEQDGRTTLNLVHESLPPDVVADHLRGWIYFLTELRRSLTGE